MSRDHTPRVGAPEYLDTTVTVDGKTDVTITADFRPPAERAVAEKKKAAALPR